MSSNAQGTVESTKPTYTLFDANAVALATFLGTPVAGASLMALNYRRLGKKGKAIATFLIGLAVSAVVVLLAWNLPRSTTTPIAMILLIAIQRIARSLQGAVVTEHAERGGRPGSKWVAFGCGAAVLVVIVGFIIVSAHAADGAKVLIGSKDEIYYSGSATREEAQTLGNSLKQIGFLTDHGVSALLAKSKDGTVMSYVTKDGVWNDTAMVSSFEGITRQAAPSVGGFPVQVRLMNSEKEIKEQSTVGQAAFSGDDTVYYFGDATAAEAQELGQSLKSDGFFLGNGSGVFLSQHSDRKMISFIVRDGAWQEPALVSGFEKVVRDVADAAGGLPITPRLMTTNLEVKKDEVIC
jgi:hypothetical protein